MAVSQLCGVRARTQTMETLVHQDLHLYDVTIRMRQDRQTNIYCRQTDRETIVLEHYSRLHSEHRRERLGMASCNSCPQRVYMLQFKKYVRLMAGSINPLYCANVSRVPRSKCEGQPQICLVQAGIYVVTGTPSTFKRMSRQWEYKIQP